MVLRVERNLSEVLIQVGEANDEGVQLYSIEEIEVMGPFCQN